MDPGRPLPGWRRAVMACCCFLALLAGLPVAQAASTATAAPLGKAVAPPSAAAASAAAPSPSRSPPAEPASTGRVWLAGPEGSGLTLAQALAQAADGDVIELMPGEYPEPLVIENRRLTLRGLGGEAEARVQRPATPMNAHAIWTVRGGEVTLENLTFRGARSVDGSGAAVRLEGGRLRLAGCRFFDNEHGLVATNDERAELVVERSVFGMAPRVVGGLHHLVSIGRIARFEVTGTRFQQGFEGHLLKTRARVNHIAHNFIHDGFTGGASLEIDIAGGGVATVVGNVIGQGADTQNPVMLSYGSEGGAWPENRLRVAHNTFINHGWLPAWYLRVFRDRLPGPVELVAVNNLLVGGGVFEWTNEGLFAGNAHARRSALADWETQGYELPPASSLRGAGVDPRRVGGPDLAPTAEFDWQRGVVPIDDAGTRTRWSPGAFQR